MKSAKSARFVVALLVAAIALGALLPRTTTLDDFVTYDEAYHWIGRTERFAEALRQHDWARTRQTGHPGVTAMYLGSLGLTLESLTLTAGHSDAPDHAPPPSPIAHLAWMRWPAAVLHALVILLAFLVLVAGRLVSLPTALIAAFLWATSPLLIAHARLLHLDALLTDFVTLSLLCVLAACRSPHHFRWLAGAGCAAGLALLTKGPALILLPTTGLLLLWQTPAPDLGTRLRSTLVSYLFWLGIALVVVVALWPALWVTPHLALERYIEKILWEGNNPYTRAQFFFGQPVTDPGPLFYPVVLLFRATPVALAGLFLLALLWRYASREHTTVAVLAAFVLVWGLIMTTGAKKFDRYLLPAWPALLIGAAAGWSTLLSRWRKKTPLASIVALVMLVVAALSLPIWYAPYYLSYYNPLVGGGAMAQKVLLVGWGEGTDQVGAYLRQRPDIERSIILSTDTRLLEPFVAAPVKSVDEWETTPARYAVFFLPSIQRNVYPKSYAAIRQQVAVPLHRVIIHGIEYAHIYQLPYPFATPRRACFGDMICLHGFTLRYEVGQAGQAGQLVVWPSWGVRASPESDYHVFLHLINETGQTVVQTDTAPGGADMLPTGQWQAGEQVAVPLPLLIPDTLPAGTYRLAMGLYDPETGERLRLTGGVGADPSAAGEQALLLDTVTLTPTQRSQLAPPRAYP
jgi:4-amino-4-deoxy-L-arabinose transferase-like glycosyltransferase